MVLGLCTSLLTALSFVLFLGVHLLPCLWGLRSQCAETWDMGSGVSRFYDAVIQQKLRKLLRYKTKGYCLSNCESDVFPHAGVWQ